MYLLQVGIDVAYKVTKYFLEVFGERISAGDPRVIEELVEAGCLGRKSGKGGSYTFSFLSLFYCFVDSICNSVGCILYILYIILIGLLLTFLNKQ